VTADWVRSQVATAAAASRSGHMLQARPGSQLPASIYHNALAVGISRGYLVASGIALAALIIAAVTIRVRREDLADAAAGAAPAMEPASSQWSLNARGASGDAASSASTFTAGRR